MLDHDNLEDFADAEKYDLGDQSDTGVAFYSALAREVGGPVLEIACGTGRVSIPIARQGYTVTGLDVVPGMIAVARRKSGNVPARWVVADGRTFDLAEQFRLVFLTGNSFQMFLTRADQEALFARVRAHLQDDGLFAFETRNPRWARSARAEPEAPAGAAVPDDGGLFALLETLPEADVRTYIDENGQFVRETMTQVYDHVTQILHWASYHRWHDGNQLQIKRTRVAVRFTFPQELATLLHYCGFTVDRQFGDWNLEPLSSTSRSIIVVCRKRI